MKFALQREIGSLLLLVSSQYLFAQGGNQVLQAYVLQGKNPSTLEREFADKSKIMVDNLRDFLKLDDQQTSELRLACQGDLSRFIQDLSELDLHTKDVDMQKLAQNHNGMQWIWPIVMPAREQMEQGLFGPESLFQKTLEGLLSEEQRQRYQLQQQQKLSRQIVAISKLTLLEIEKSMPLTKKQRDRIMELVESSPKPKRIQENMSYYVGLVMLGKLPEQELSQILTVDQLKIFLQITRRAQQIGGIEW